MDYQPNPKHKPTPSPGRRGSICPQGVDASRLLSQSVLIGRKRDATDGEGAFCAQCHDTERDLWHGYPVGWREVPTDVVSEWLKQSLVDGRTIRRARRHRR
jgi:hypothetical protein